MFPDGRTHARTPHRDATDATGREECRKVGRQERRKACREGGIKQACMHEGIQGGRKKGRLEGRKPCKEASRHAGMQEGRKA